MKDIEKLAERAEKMKARLQKLLATPPEQLSEREQKVQTFIGQLVERIQKARK